MSEYKPPFQMSDRLTVLLAEISELVGRITVLHKGTLNPHLRRANRIIVVDGGRIAEEGTYDELVERGGLFAELVARQRLDA